MAVLTFYVVRGGTINIFTRQTSSLPQTDIQIVNFNPCDGSSAVITIKNKGPVTLQVSSEDDWAVFINNSAVTLCPMGPAQVDVGETIELHICGCFDENAPQSIKVFGPQNSQAWASWAPPG